MVDLIQTYLFYLSYNSLLSQKKCVNLWLLHEKESLTEQEFLLFLPEESKKKLPNKKELLVKLRTLKNDLDGKNIQVISKSSHLYPKQLQHLFNPPLFLYVKGNVNKLNAFEYIALVGSRMPSVYGEAYIKPVVQALSEKNYGIISGLASGVDQLCHIEAVKAKTATIAVLGFGHDYCYPKENERLLQFLSKHEVTISEYPPHFKPQKYQFVRRNAIIAALSKSVIIIEARERSGSLLTAYEALELGKNVYVCPGPLFHPQFKGSHQLISEGATILTEFDNFI